MVPIKFTKLNARANPPKYMSTGAAGCDIVALLDEPMDLRPMERAAVPTGLAVEIPLGYEIQVRPRSGLSLKKGLTVVNAPGTIDSDYRGEIKVLLVNLSHENVRIESGERIAQLVIAKVEQMTWTQVESLSETARDAGGFGSTGNKELPV